MPGSYQPSVTGTVTVRDFFLGVGPVDRQREKSYGDCIEYQIWFGLVIMEDEGSYRNNYLDKNYLETVGCLSFYTIGKWNSRRISRCHFVFIMFTSSAKTSKK
jgi:hypothetical protein